MSSDQRPLVRKLRSFFAQLMYLPWTLRLIWTAARGWTLAWAILLVVQGLLPAAIVYLTRLLVDGLVAAIGTGGSWESLRPVMWLAALMAGVMLLIELMQSISSWIRTAQAELIRDYLSGLVHEKAMAVDLAFYESPEYHDRLDRARNDLTNRPPALLESGGNLLQNAITLLAMGALLTPYGVWLPIVLLASTVPAFYIVLHFNWRFHRWWERTTSDRRRGQYYDTMLTHSAVAAELRLFDLGPHFRSVYQTLRQRLRTEQLKLARDQSLARLGAGGVGVLIACGALAWMVWRALQGLVTLGDLALFYQALNRGQSLLRSLLENAGQIYANTLFLGNLFEFLELEAQVVDPPQPFPAPTALREGLRFQRVTFCYPGSEGAILQNFNLTIPAGQIVAIVGANGAGKSTLLKLLCRFYDPQAGCIMLDGVDIRNLSLRELRRMLTVLFQWPVAYQTTAAQNIAMGDLAADPSIAELESAARSAGAHAIIARLPQGYDTRLGKWFAHGTDLSAGEWQRLALARAFLRRAPIIVLDEPTSALDSWAEADWFDRFRVLANGRTAIIITHRFTIARRADMIHVMDAGRIVESGPHDDLLAQGGLYARSWFVQVQAGPHPAHAAILPALCPSIADQNDGAVRP
jgi:ATP-binding cassette, subfamily B, bacterial